MCSLRKFFITISVAVVISTVFFLTGNAFAATDPNASVAAAVQAYFPNTPIMIAIAKCESGPRQFENDGTPLLGGTGTMVGVFQLDETLYHAQALALGFNIDTLAGNLGYASYLYGKEGTEPWISSFGCWDSALATSTPVVATTTASVSSIASTTASAPALTLDLSLGSIDPQVLILQQMLNADGFILATSGPGSPGNETTKFGSLTYAALKKFQCANGIVCSGEEATTGYGLLNAVTRAALLATASTTIVNTSSSISSTSTAVASTTTVAGATSTAMASTTTVISPVATTTIVATASVDNPAEVAELQSRISALVAIVAQLEAELAAR